MNNVRNGSTGNGKRVWTAWLIMLCILAASAAGTALGEEDTIVPN